MFRNYFAAALRNLVRNRLYSTINVVGLAVGFAAALLVALFVHEELSFDQWLPGHEDVYEVFSTVTVASRDGHHEDNAGMPSDAAQWMRVDLPGVTVARLQRARGAIRHGDVEELEPISWVDPDFFKIAPVPVIAGDLMTALSSPDNVVISRAIARKYFGADAPIGQTLEFSRAHALRIAAVIDDLPSNSNFSMPGNGPFSMAIVASSTASFSPLAQVDARTGGIESRGLDWTATYVRLPAGASRRAAEISLQEAIPRHYPAEIAGTAFTITARLVPLSRAHFEPAIGGMPISTLNAIAAVGALTVVVAAINFLNLMTARSMRRAVEVGVRKVSGARRRNLVIQFVGEALVYILLSVVAALAIAAVTLPRLSAFIQRTVDFDLHSPAAIITALAALLLLGVATSVYPGLVLASFPPAMAFRSRRERFGGQGRLRWILVVCQFAILIGLSLATAIIYRQTEFALNQGLRLKEDQLLLVATRTCSDAFKQAVATLPGVRGAACSGAGIAGNRSATIGIMPDGKNVVFDREPSDYGLLELYGLHPLVGRFFSRDYGTDDVETATTQGALVINEALMHAMGFASPENAVGQSIPWINQVPEHPSLEPRRSIIIGVVPDFSTRSVAERINPTAFSIGSGIQYLNVKIDKSQIPETLRSIDGLWKQMGDPQPIRRLFLNDYVERLYQDITREGTLFACFAVTAIFIAVLGLFGLSAFATEQRTREIGIRKAMGANSQNILRLLLWQFAKPVLWANAIAWPVAYFIMRRWLEGFAYHIDLSLWMFLAASGLALAIALGTVIGHALLVARAKPVTALRYE